jgi:hypothetical protein
MFRFSVRGCNFDPDRPCIIIKPRSPPNGCSNWNPFEEHRKTQKSRQFEGFRVVCVASQASDVGSIPIARSINPVDAIEFGLPTPKIPYENDAVGRLARTEAGAQRESYDHFIKRDIEVFRTNGDRAFIADSGRSGHLGRDDSGIFHFSDSRVHQELKRSRIVRCGKAKPPGTPAHSGWHPKTERLYEEVSKAGPVVSTGSVSFPSSFSVSRILGCQKIGKIIDTEGEARSSFQTRPAFLGAVRRWGFLPTGPF